LRRIEKIARFESLVQLPEKPRDPDWPVWAAAATKDGHRFMATADTKVDALARLLEELHK
jgi:hypothetical protein